MVSAVLPLVFAMLAVGLEGLALVKGVIVEKLIVAVVLLLVTGDVFVVVGGLTIVLSFVSADMSVSD